MEKHRISSVLPRWAAEFNKFSPGFVKFCHGKLTRLQHNPILISSSVFHCSTTSLNPLLFHPNTAPSFCHIETKICKLIQSHTSSFEETVIRITPNILRTSCNFSTSLYSKYWSPFTSPILPAPPLTSIITAILDTIHHSHLNVPIWPVYLDP